MTNAAPNRASDICHERPVRKRTDNQSAIVEATMATAIEASSSVGSYRIIGVIWIAAMPQ